MARTRRSREPDKKPGDSELHPTLSLVLQDSSGAVIDNIDAVLLHGISEKNSIAGGAVEAGISYRAAWERLTVMQRKLGRRIVLTQAGGKEGGGASLTKEGETLIAQYRRLNNYLFSALGESDFWQHVSYRLSARNRLKARIVEVQKGSITSGVKMKLAGGGELTSIISNEAVEELDLQVGESVEAIIKATEVIIAKRDRVEDIH